MSVNLAYTITPSSISIFIDGRSRIVSRGAVNFERVYNLILQYGETHNHDIRDDIVNDLKDALDIGKFVARVTEGRIKIGDTGVMFDTTPMHGVAADRLINLLKTGADVRPLARFLDRLHNNPTLTVPNEMYMFLESGHLPLTDDGCFLAYKKVGADYSSSHLTQDGAMVYNHVGKTVSMRREDCDTDRNSTCSRGLHFCSFDYLPGFGTVTDSRVVVVKVAPEDVVAIPRDHKNTKGRACKYDIIAEVPEEECKHLFEGKYVVSSFGTYDNGEDEHNPSYHGDDITVCEDPFCDCDAGVHMYMGEMPNDDQQTSESASEDEASSDAQRSEGDLHVSASEDVSDGLPTLASDTAFRFGRKSFTADQVLSNVALYGQRGWAKKSGIPRTTIQGWIGKIKKLLD